MKEQKNWAYGVSINGVGTGFLWQGVFCQGGYCESPDRRAVYEGRDHRH